MHRTELVILTPNPFPIGNVATNRLSTYAVSLAANGYKVGVVVLKGTEDPDNPNNPDRKGVYKKVWFEYMSATPIWVKDKAFFEKIFLYIVGFFKAVALLIRRRPKSVLLYSNDLFYMLAFKIVSLFLGLSYYIDKSEYPIVCRKNDGLYKWIYLRSFQVFDGLLVMTRELERYYSKIAKASARVFRLPMSVDFERFNSAKFEFDNFASYFGCVFGIHNRDCIIDTIMAFDSFCDMAPESNIKLLLVGDFDHLIGRDEIQGEILKCNFQNRIVRFGVLNPNQMPGFLSNSTALITTPRSYVSGGFPTKLGEYLASGKPVILTSAGEIPDFMTDGVDCLLANPGDIQGIAHRMLYVFKNPDASTAIGLSGKETAMRCFNVDAYVDDLAVFFGLLDK